MSGRIFHICYRAEDGDNLARIRERSFQRAVRALRRVEPGATDAHQVAAGWAEKHNLTTYKISIV